MRIVFLSGLYPPASRGGGEISTYLIAEGLKARGHEVKVITEQNSHLGLLKKPLFERQHSQKVAARLKQVLLEADVVHAHDFRSALALSEVSLPNAVVTARDYAQVCGTTNNVLIDGGRCLCTLHDIRCTQRYREVGWPRRWARAWQYRYNLGFRVHAFEKFRHEIFISRAQKQEIEAHPVRAKFGMLKKLPQHTAVIYNPVPPEYLAMPVEKGRAGHVLYVGRLEDYKGVRLLLTAWEKVARAVPEAHLKLVGEGAQQKEYERWVGNAGLQYRVTFAGKLPHERLMRTYDEATVVVAPHLWLEPFGRTVAEAVARGKVVVAANSGGPAEIIQDNTNGLLFERGSVSALAGRLQEALQLQHYTYIEISRAARDWTAKSLRVDSIARQYEEFYLAMK